MRYGLFDRPIVRHLGSGIRINKRRRGIIQQIPCPTKISTCICHQKSRVFFVPIQSEITAPDMRWRTPLPFIQKLSGTLTSFLSPGWNLHCRKAVIAA